MMQAVMNQTELSSSSSPQIMMQAVTDLCSSSVGPTLGCCSILRVNIPNRIELCCSIDSQSHMFWLNVLPNRPGQTV